MSVATIRRQACSAAASIAIALLALPALAQDTRPYTQGNVLEVTSILSKPGKFDEYVKWLSGSYRQQQEELKKAGIVLDYAIYSTVPQHPGDPDLYLVVTYKNMAALDQLDAQSEIIEKKIFGSLKKAAEGMASRESMRTILGSQLVRELKLK
jgi:hypothetical protein